MEERDLSICLEQQVEVKPVNFCRFNDFPEEIQEVKAVKGFCNKADQDCQTEVSGEHLKVIVFCYLFCMRAAQVFRENSSTIIFAVVTFSYATFLGIHYFQAFVGYEKTGFVYGFQAEDFKNFICCGENGVGQEYGEFFDICEMRKTGLGQDFDCCGEGNKEILQEIVVRNPGVEKDLRQDVDSVEFFEDETNCKEELKNEDFSRADQ
jgi:hypothetical protein